MSRRVLILDTSVLCCWLRVPGKEEAGPIDDRWDHARIQKLLAEAERKGGTFVLPLASLIETGNHIAQAPKERYETARRLAQHLRDAADANNPWAAFTEQADLWQADKLKSLAEAWPSLAAQRLSMGDATIKDVAEYYARVGYEVEILTGDAGLKSYQPASPPSIPRRRR